MAEARQIAEDFEEAYDDCLAAMSNPNLKKVNPRDTDQVLELYAPVDLSVQRFLDVCKRMDCFILQQRHLQSVEKPENLLVENNQELAGEVKRKDEPGMPRPQPPPAPPQNLPAMQGSPSQMQPQVVPQPGTAAHGHHMMHPHNMPPMTTSPAPVQPGMMMQSQPMHPQQHLEAAQQPDGLQGPLVQDYV